MTLAAACPGCASAPVPPTASDRDLRPTHHLLLPGIHCAGCIRGVERTLADLPDIQAARVNLSQKRVSITADPDADPDPWIRALAKAGYEAHDASADTASDAAEANDRALILRLGVAGFAMMNVMLLSVAVWSGATDTTRELFHWISAAIALPATFFSATPFFENAWRGIKARRLGMDVPIAVAILLASALSLHETIVGGAHAYFDAALSLTFFLLAGRVLDQRMRSRVRSAASDLALLEPSRTQRIEEGVPVSRRVSEIRQGDVLQLAAGARVPVDAELLDPVARVDRSLLTGESDAVTVARGDILQAGEVILSGAVTMRAIRVGEDTTLRRMAALVAVAETARGRYTSLADRAAALYTPLVHAIAFLGFLGWIALSGDLHRALTVAIATLIITCPCALGLAVPAVATAATGRLFRNGLLVTSNTALERLAEVDTVVFDKTGTLTEAALLPPEGLTGEELGILKALAQSSDHPLSRGLALALHDAPAGQVTQVEEIPGQGVSAMSCKGPVRLGSAAWTGLSDGTEADAGFRIGDQTRPLTRSERLRPDAAKAVRTLRDLGLPVHILSGDRAEKADKVALELGAESVRAGATPEDKQALIAELQARGHKVLMVGDGLNDTAALASAHASIAPGSALDASRSAADVVLIGGRLTGVPEAIRTARSARRRILENFGLAAGYNSIAIPLALAGFATPLLAALAMSASSVTVVLNALRVR